ncbi:MAG: YdcF family protein [Bacteroidota bacterium]
MFFILSKTLYYVLMPITWVIGILVYALFVKNRKYKQRALKIALLAICLLGNKFIINELLLAWEYPPTQVEALPTYDVGIVLTGITNSAKYPQDRTYFQKGADRITHTLQLYKQGKLKKILISGGLYWRRDQRSEAKALQEFLVIGGVPKKDILIEENSYNTRENAINSAKILKEKFPNQKYLLITSAFHLRRAKGCFQQQGVEVTTFAVDFYTQQRTLSPDFWLIPSEKAFYYWYVCTHEVVGYIVYKVLGYA